MFNKSKNTNNNNSNSNSNNNIANSLTVKNNNVKTSQLAVMLLCLFPVTKLMLLPTILATSIGRDSYMTILIHGIFDIILLFAIVLSYKICPNVSFMKMLERSLGKFVSKVIIVIYIAYFFFRSANTMIEQKNLFSDDVYDDMSVFTFYLPFIILIFYTTLKGIKSLARVTNFFSLFLLFSLLVIMALSIVECDFSDIFPILDGGVKPLATSVFQTFIWFGDPIFILGVLGSITLDKNDKARKLQAQNKEVFKIKEGNFKELTPSAKKNRYHSLSTFSMKQKNVLFNETSQKKYLTKTNSKYLFFALIAVAIITSFFFVLITGIYADYAIKQTSVLSKISKFAIAFSGIGRFDWLFIMTLTISTFLYATLMLTTSVKLTRELFNTNSKVIISAVLCLTLFVFTLIFTSKYEMLFKSFSTFMPYVLIPIQYIFPFFLPVIAAITRRKENATKTQ